MLGRTTLCLCASVVVFTPTSFAAAAFVPFGSEAAWRIAAGTTAFEDFESFPVGAQITSLPALGISFDVLAGGGHPQIYLHNVPTTPYGQKHLGNFPNGINPINQFDDIVARPLPGYTLTALGFWNGDGQADTFVARAYDSSGVLLGSVGAFKSQFAGFVSTTSVARVVFDGNTGDGWNHLDGLQTNATANTVPEPSALALVAIGGVMMLFVRSRQM